MVFKDSNYFGLSCLRTTCFGFLQVWISAFAEWFYSWLLLCLLYIDILLGAYISGISVFLKYWKSALFSCQEKWLNGNSQYLHLYSIFSHRIWKPFENTKSPKIQGIFITKLCDSYRSVTDYSEWDEVDSHKSLRTPGFTWGKTLERWKTACHIK